MRLAAPSASSTSTAIPEPGRVSVDDDGVRVGALARHADVLASDAGRGRVQPLLAHGPAARRAPDDPQPRHDGRLDRARRRGGRDAGRAAPARRLGDRRGSRRAAARSRRPTSSSGRWSRRWATTRSPPRRSSRPCRAGAGVAFEEIARRHGDYALAGSRPSCAVEGEQVVDVRAGYLSVSDVPTVVDLTGVVTRPAATRATPRWRRLEPAGRHPRHRRLPRPPRPVLTRASWSRRPHEHALRSRRRHPTTDTAGTLHGRHACASTAPRTTISVPARRLLSDALRHDLRPHRHPRRLRARRLRRLHGAGRRARRCAPA